MSSKVIFFAIISTAYAGVYIDGPCPDVKPVDYLNITAFAKSPWYEVASYPNDAENKGDCTTISYNYSKSGISFKDSIVKDGKLHTIVGKLEYAPKAGTTGILNYKSPSFLATEATENMLVRHVLVDLNSHCIAYECTHNETTNKSHVYSWIVSRTKTLSADAKMAIDKFIQSAPYLDASLFYWDKFDDEICKLEA